MDSRVPCLLEFMAFYNQSPPLECWPSLQTLEWVEYSKDGGLLLSRSVYKDGGFCLASTLLLSLALASSALWEAAQWRASCNKNMHGEVLVGPVLWFLTFLDYSMRAVEKAMAPHCSPLAWKIPWMEEPGRLQSMGLLRVRHDRANSLSLFTFMHWRRKWQPTPVFLLGESQGRQSLVDCHLWDRTESDTTEAT